MDAIIGVNIATQQTFGLADSVAIVPKIDIKAMSYLDWLKTTKSFLSLDISVRGTGWAMWKDEKLTWGRISLKNEDNVLRVDEFRTHLLKLIDDYAFDYYFVEDVIQSCNFKTLRALVSLNDVLDGIILEKKILPPIQSFKVSNTTWKKNLKAIAGSDFVVKSVNYTNGSDKECTKACLTALGITPEELKAGVYTDKQVEDICDALGMALGTIAVQLEKTPVVKSKVLTTDIRKGYRIKQFEDLESARKSAERSAKNKAKPIVELDIMDTESDLIRFMAKQIPDNPNAVFIVHVPVSKCCNFLLVKRLETTLEDYYLTITKG